MNSTCVHHADGPTTTPQNPVTFWTILSVFYWLKSTMLALLNFAASSFKMLIAIFNIEASEEI